jgi:hypothetical protein
MANYLLERQWYIDTPVSIARPEFGPIYVKEIRWENYAPGNTLVITTTTGGTLVNETVGAGETDLGVMRFGPFGWVNGFDVTTLTGGSNITVTVSKG